MKILLTGGAGFIGSACLARWRAGGDEVVVVDCFHELLYPRAVKEANVAWARTHGDFELVEADLRDEAAMRALFSRHAFDAIVHLAAVAGVRPSIDNAPLYYDINVTGTARLLGLAREAGITRQVLASSSSVYGNQRKTPFAEDDPIHAPVSPYAASKHGMELMAHAHQSLHGGDLSCLRFFTVYGPRQRPDMAINAFLRKVAAGEEIARFGDGSTGRDYTFIDDIVDGVDGALRKSKGFRVYNLGGDQVVRLDELIEAIGETVGKKPRIRQLPMQPGDVDLTCADLTRARSELGYAPKVALLEGLARMWSWMNAPR